MIDKFLLKTQKKEVYNQVDTHAVCVDTVRKSIKDRSTYMQYASTQLEEVSKIGRHTYTVRRHSQQKYFKDVDSLKGCVDIVFNIQLTMLMQLYIVLTYLKIRKGKNVDKYHECVDTVKQLC